MKNFCTVTSLLLFATILVGCETVEGFGRDLEKVGGKIEKAADKDGSSAPVEDAKENK